MIKTDKKQNWLGRLGTIALEIFSVVLAVLLALAANDWRDSREAAELTQRSIISIKQELKNNLQLINEAHQHHQKILELIQNNLPENENFSETEAQNLLKELYQLGIVKPGAVLATAWSTAQISGAVQGIDYDLAIDLSKVYTFQSDYHQATQAVNNAMNLANFIGTDPGNFISGVYEGVNTHWWQEKRLIKAYKEALQKIETFE